MEIILTIKKSIDWYNQNYKKATISQLIDLKTKLVTENYYLAELVSENNCFCLQWENEKKVKFAKEKQKNINESMQIGKAESKAECEIENERTQHTEYKIVFDRLKLLHNQVNEVCNDIMQRIAILRQESKNTIGI
jgi:hypothetical protein